MELRTEICHLMSGRTAHQGDPKNDPGEVIQPLCSALQGPAKWINNALAIVVRDGYFGYLSGKSFLSETSLAFTSV